MPNPTPFKQLSWFNQLIYAAGVGFGSGLTAKAPGTFGSAASLLLLPIWLCIGINSSIIAIVAMAIFGVFICQRTAEIMDVHDDGRIVWDEFVGQSITLLPILPLFGHFSLTIYAVLIIIAFALFRLFDIWKPWPISWADQKLHGGLGIMLDDILAGLIAAIILFILTIAIL